LARLKIINKGEISMRKVACLMGLVLLSALSAAAQDDSRIDIFAGYSFVHTGPGAQLSSFNANGGVASVALNFSSWLSGVVEGGGVHVSKIGGADVDATAETFMAGPKISPLRGSRLSPFAQVLAGFIHTNPGYSQQTINHNTFAMAPGAGLDWNATRHLGIRLAQVDYLFTRMPTSTGQVNWNNFRYSGGVVIRF
jgi:opacity protein-like surface antigen